MAILPQFAKLRNRKYSDTDLPATLLDWLAWLSLSRLCATVDGAMGLYIYSSSGTRFWDEVFYLSGNVMNLVILADFLYYYLCALVRGKRMVLPT
eukprot:gnl/MRDRNA2_/MRDRNA2_278566_c0_seq1.p1 gnl/MRDRNA2_/MRDRNA2_278566_c0~~gnl/MRDRNA2_/MRDRNA2_278566_c0_seq1.p1  ORF type:complete len:106 (-),score=7.70 gnl/MRDRNA2_/MRDRNA2_278566_c0_seq1:69-353(-)